MHGLGDEAAEAVARGKADVIAGFAAELRTSPVPIR
jgi:hypothetical protein